MVVLSTFEHRSYELADMALTFTPQTDLAILNYIANHIIQTKRVNRDFVDKHTTFREGNTDIGYGCAPTIRCKKPPRTPAMPAAPSR